MIRGISPSSDTLDPYAPPMVGPTQPDPYATAVPDGPDALDMIGSSLTGIDKRLADIGTRRGALQNSMANVKPFKPTPFDEQAPSIADLPVNNKPLYDYGAGHNAIKGALKYLPLALLLGPQAAQLGATFLKGKQDQTQQNARDLYSNQESQYQDAERTNQGILQNRMAGYESRLKQNEDLNKNDALAASSGLSVYDKENDNLQAEEKGLQNEKLGLLTEQQRIKVSQSKAISKQMADTLKAMMNATDDAGKAQAAARYNQLARQQADLLGIGTEDVEQKMISDVATPIDIQALRGAQAMARTQLTTTTSKDNTKLRVAAQKDIADKNRKSRESIASDANKNHIAVANISATAHTTGAQIAADAADLGHVLQFTGTIEKMKQQARASGQQVDIKKTDEAIRVFQTLSRSAGAASSAVQKLQHDRSVHAHTLIGDLRKEALTIDDANIEEANKAFKEAKAKMLAAHTTVIDNFNKSGDAKIPFSPDVSGFGDTSDIDEMIRHAQSNTVRSRINPTELNSAMEKGKPKPKSSGPQPKKTVYDTPVTQSLDGTTFTITKRKQNP